MIKESNSFEILSVDSKTLASGRCSLECFVPDKVERVLSWHRDDYWHSPVHAKDFSKIRKNTQNILIKTAEEKYVLLMGLAHYDNFAAFVYDKGELQVEFSGTLPGEERESTDVVAYGVGSNPFVLVKELFEVVSERFGSFDLREEKIRPEFTKYLGWCTWDAFYQDVDAQKVESGLQSFAKIGVHPGFVVLDDGALSTDGDYLNSFETSKEKFPGGLHDFVRNLKANYSLKYFGLWHAFEGYWAGLNPNGELAQKYGVVHNKGNIRPWDKEKPLYDLYLVSPEKAEEFYDDWYRYLKSEEVDFVKVDGQCAMEFFTKDVLGRAGTMAKFQHAMQDGVKNNFGEGNVISCMCNGSDVYFNLNSGNVWRNSNDYFPKRDDSMQKMHVAYNIYNAFISANFAWPDWDMFQTYHQHSEYHAISRALSGGPVYVCDYPGEQNEELIKKLVLNDGRVPLFDRPALPTADTLMLDVLSGEGLAKMTNVKKCGDVLLAQIGVFNCDVSEGEKSVKSVIKVTDVPEFAEMYDAEENADMVFAVYDMKNDIIHEMRIDSELTVEMSGLNAAAYVVSPIVKDIAVLGVKGKYAMAACVDKVCYGCSNEGEHIPQVTLDEAVPAETDVMIYKRKG